MMRQIGYCRVMPSFLHTLADFACDSPLMAVLGGAATLLTVGSAVRAWVKGYRVVRLPLPCAYCSGTGIDPGISAKVPCRICEGTGDKPRR